MLALLYSAVFALGSMAKPVAPAPLVRPGIITACALVSQTEAEQALGRALGKGKEEYHREHTTCDYSGGNGVLTITLHRLSTELDVNLEMRNLRMAFPMAGFRPALDGGAHGFFMDLPDAGTQLHVIQGRRYYFLISILGFGAPDQVSKAADTLARKVLDRL